MSFTDPSTEDRSRHLLARCGLDAHQHLEPVFSYVNDIWLGETVIVRTNTGRFPGAFHLEAEILGVLDGRVPHPEVLGYGTDELGEWMILRRVAGRTWTRAWPDLTELQRRGLVDELAQAMVAIGEQQLPDGVRNEWLELALASDDTVHEAHHPPVEALPALFRRFGALAGGRDLRAALEDFALQRKTACRTDDQLILVHADLHWDNLMVHDGHLAAVLDWEGARMARAELELDTPLRFSVWPWLPVTEDEEHLCRPEEYVMIPGWLRGAAPSLFVQERLPERLELHAIAHDLVQALHFPHETEAPRPGTAWWRLREMAAGRSHLTGLLL